MLQQLYHLLFTIVYINQVLVGFTDLVPYFELPFSILRTHVLCKVLKVAARYVDHLFLAYWLASFWFNLCGWSLISDCFFAIKACVFLSVFLLWILGLYFWSIVLLVAVFIRLLQISNILLVLKVKECGVIVLFKVLLGRLISLSFFNFQLCHFLLHF